VVSGLILGAHETDILSLSVCAASPAIVRQKSLIEATSSLMTYSLPLTPVEILHHPNKLELIGSVIANPTSNAYRHPEVLLDLAAKLGSERDSDAVTVHSMLVTACIRAGEWSMGSGHCEEMFMQAKNTRKKLDANPAADESVREKTWISCFDLAKHTGLETAKRIQLFGWVVELCPASEMGRVLAAWLSVEREQMQDCERVKRRRVEGRLGSYTAAGHSTPPSPMSRSRPTTGVGPSPSSPSFMASERVLGSRTAARAARLAIDFSERLHLKTYAASLAPRDRSADSTSASISGSTRGHGYHLGGDDQQPRTSGELSRHASERGSSRTAGAAEVPAPEGRQGEREFGSLLGGLGVSEEDRMRDHAKKAFVKGVGWLLGAEEHEIS
jgi:hypothetical protein